MLKTFHFEINFDTNNSTHSSVPSADTGITHVTHPSISVTVVEESAEKNIKYVYMCMYYVHV